jgi:hypothetical protein
VCFFWRERASFATHPPTHHRKKKRKNLRPKKNSSLRTLSYLFVSRPFSLSMARLVCCVAKEEKAENRKMRIINKKRKKT